MSKSREPKPVALSGKIYERLLALYPSEHRREYGPAMAQLFNDQCRDAWTESRGWGLALLWLRTSIDLVKTSALEHLRVLKRRKSMFNRIVMALRNDSAPWTTFLALFGTVFVLVLGSSLLFAFLTPEQYASEARIAVARTFTNAVGEALQSYDPYLIQSQFEMIRSEAVLGRVVKQLNLAESWGKRSGGGTLSEADTIKLLRERLDLSTVRNTDMINVRFLDHNPSEASRIANALAETYRDLSWEKRQSTTGVETSNSRFVLIVEHAMPGLRPIWPNKYLIVFLGLFGGAFLALLGGGAGVFFVLLRRRRSTPAATN
jgi:capsular polysaccharide biosynthesis protein